MKPSEVNPIVSIENLYQLDIRVGTIEAVNEVENSNKLTIALLDGLSLGGGSELALACQAIIATPAGSIGFTETGIGIIPGLGGMLRLARHVGPELAKYYVFTGTAISADDALKLGVVTRLVAPTEVKAAIKELASEGKPEKYRPREIPEQFQPLAHMGSTENAARLLNGQLPEGVPQEIAAKTAKFIGYKAPLALKIANEIIENKQGIFSVNQRLRVLNTCVAKNYTNIYDESCKCAGINGRTGGCAFAL